MLPASPPPLQAAVPAWCVRAAQARPTERPFATHDLHELRLLLPRWCCNHGSPQAHIRASAGVAIYSRASFLPRG
ncbi:hypothetical protein GQ53DRAFT_754187 [Thozetella sp. PMI_491]|nr:hypothetical protein GQ53DRAFT_754187 [Thozetella sp. PMI_491]